MQINVRQSLYKLEQALRVPDSRHTKVVILSALSIGLLYSTGDIPRAQLLIEA